MEKDERIKSMLFSTDWEMRALGITMFIEYMRDGREYSFIKGLIAKLPPNGVRRRFRIEAQRKHVLNILKYKQIQNETRGTKKTL